MLTNAEGRFDIKIIIPQKGINTDNVSKIFTQITHLMVNTNVTTEFRWTSECGAAERMTRHCSLWESNLGFIPSESVNVHNSYS